MEDLQKISELATGIAQEAGMLFATRLPTLAEQSSIKTMEKHLVVALDRLRQMNAATKAIRDAHPKTQRALVTLEYGGRATPSPLRED